MRPGRASAFHGQEVYQQSSAVSVGAGFPPNREADPPSADKPAPTTVLMIYFLPMNSTLHKRLLIAASIMLLAILVARGLEDTIRGNINDFLSYLEGGMALRSGTPLYFDRAEPSFKYSPFFALLMVPLTALPPNIAYLLWITVMVFQLFFIIRGCRNLIDANHNADRPFSLWLYSLSIFFTVNFTFTNFDKGQANIFVLFWVVWAFMHLEKKRPRTAGLCLAVGILAKMSPLLLIPYLIWRKEFSCVVWCGIGLVVFSLLPWFIQGPSQGLQTFVDWIRWTREAHDPNFLASQPNQSLAGAVHRLFLKQETYWMRQHGGGILQVPLWVVKSTYLAASAVLFGAFLSKPNPALEATPYELKLKGVDLASILLAVTIIFPIGWKYCLVPLLLPVMVVLTYIARSKGRDILVLSFFFGFVFLATTLPSLPSHFARVELHFRSCVTWGMLLLAGAIWKIKQFPLPTARVL